MELTAARNPTHVGLRDRRSTCKAEIPVADEKFFGGSDALAIYRPTGGKRPLRSGLLRSSPNLRVEILTQTRIGEPLARLSERHFVFIGPSASPFGEDGRDQSLPIDQ